MLAIFFTMIFIIFIFLLTIYKYGKNSELEEILNEGNNLSKKKKKENVLTLKYLILYIII